MTFAPVVRFIEDFGRFASERPEAAAARAGMEARPVAPRNAEAPKPDASALAAEREAALAAAREEGRLAGRAEIEATIAGRVAEALREAAEIAETSRRAEIAALGGALEKLLEGYDAWIDALFQTAVKPLAEAAMTAAALERFRAMVAESVDVRGGPVVIEGDPELAGRLAAMLAGNGVEARVEGKAGGGLSARIDGTVLRARLDRMRALVGEAMTEPGAREVRHD